MHIRMTQTQKGSVDGMNLKEYEAGSEHDLTQTERARDLARVFVREGWAVELLDLKSVAMPSAPTPAAEELSLPVLTGPILAEQQVMRLPEINEYVASGYPEGNYEAFLSAESARGEKLGLKVEIRAPHPSELDYERYLALMTAPKDEAAPSKGKKGKGK